MHNLYAYEQLCDMYKTLWKKPVGRIMLKYSYIAIRGTVCEYMNWIITGQSGCALLMKLQKQHGINMEGWAILKYS
jgi:hypothetical protein